MYHSDILLKMKYIEANSIKPIDVKYVTATGRDGYYRRLSDGHEIGLSQAITSDRVHEISSLVRSFSFFDSRYNYIRDMLLEKLENIDIDAYAECLKLVHFHEERHLLQELRMQAVSLQLTVEQASNGFNDADGKKVFIDYQEDVNIRTLSVFIEEYMEIQAHLQETVRKKAGEKSTYIGLFLMVYRALDYLNFITQNPEYKGEKLFYSMHTYLTAIFVGTAFTKELFEYFYTDLPGTGDIDEKISTNLLLAVQQPETFIDLLRSTSILLDIDRELDTVCFRLRTRLSDLAEKYTIPSSELLYVVNSPKMVSGF